MLYKEHILGEKPQSGFIPLSTIAPAPKAAAVETEETVMGD
jgi:hypothetical protein